MRLKTLFILCLLVTQVGCLSWFSDKIGTGVARLTIRNSGAILLAVNSDETCGFESDKVNDNPEVQGEVGTMGKAIWRVEDCTVDLADWKELSEDCEDVITKAKGKITVTAEKVVVGKVTGDPEKPVVPIQSDAAIFNFSKVEFKNFEVRRSDNKAYMKMIKGSISFSIQPKLAKDEENSVCSVVTPNISFTNIRYGSSNVFVDTGDQELDVDIDSSNLEAQNGIFNEHKNRLTGTITVWGKKEVVPMGGDNDGLNPDFDIDVHNTSFACKEELAQPFTYSCDLEPKLGEAAARLSVLTFGSLAKYVNAETRCGFESDNVKNSFEAKGEVGNTIELGEVTYRVQDCEINLPDPVEISTDCLGVTSYIQGSMLVSGTKTVTGFLTGDSETPIVPNSIAPATLAVEATMTNVRVTKSDTDKYITFNKGTISGASSPQMMRDKDKGACSISTPNAEFRDIQVTGATARITSGKANFDVSLSSANLYAINGVSSGKVNYLSGNVTVDDVYVEVPLNGVTELNPDYVQADFDAGYDCEENAEMPLSNADCSFEKTLAEGASRLLIQAFGVVVKTTDLDEDCGYGSSLDQAWGLLNNVSWDCVFGDALCTVVWEAENCALGGPAPKFIIKDCVDTSYWLNGNLVINATKTVTGALALAMDALQPVDRESASVVVHDITFNEYSTYKVDIEGEVQPYLQFHNGTLSGTSLPITGEAADSDGSYFIKTSVAGYQDITVSNAQTTLYIGNMQFKLTLDSSTLQGFNGTFGDRSNFVTGNVSVNGNAYSFPEDFPLNPDYDQTEFDDTYRCKDNLKEPVPFAGD